MNNRALTVLAVKLLALFIAVGFINLASGAAITWGVSVYNAASSGFSLLVALIISLFGLLSPFLAYKLWRFAQNISINIEPDSQSLDIPRLENLIIIAVGIWLAVSCIPELLNAGGVLVRYFSVKELFTQGLIPKEPFFPIPDFWWAVGNLLQIFIGLWLVRNPETVTAYAATKKHGL